MGVFRLYAEIIAHLQKNPDILVNETLEKIAAVYHPFAYIGNRKTLEAEVLRNAERFCKCGKNLAKTLEEAVVQWYGTSSWKSDSGAFPDFILAWEDTKTLGDGAMLELKDSRSQVIASFNSTIPSARKNLQKLTKLVKDSVYKYEECFKGPGPDERECFYLVRTHRGIRDKCQLSLIHGTFFETLPIKDLLSELWKQLFRDANVPEDYSKASEYLSKLDREEIAKTRVISSASIKPRLRIMSEIHREANPHNYDKIGYCSFNLILKPPEHIRPNQYKDWIWECFNNEKASLNESDVETFLLKHKRNGEYYVVQYKVIESGYSY